jgi:D-cysteine desulfhydrase
LVASLHSLWPEVSERVDAVPLGQFPTPVEALAEVERSLACGPLFIKRDDLSSPIYGGNKVRTLEVLFGRARASGAREIFSTGAFGSNHAAATVLHAPRAGLIAGAILFPQPVSHAALENLRVTAVRAERLVILPHWSVLPPAMWLMRAKNRIVMLPGGATAYGALGYVAAGIELAAQVAEGVLPAPGRIYVGVGSTCTAAGLLVGLVHGAQLGIGFTRPPTVVAVRVTPWPVTSRFRILGLAVRTSELLAELTQRRKLRLSREDLAPLLEIDRAELGAGYGYPTANGASALSVFRQRAQVELDTTYSAKAAAAFLRGAHAHRGDPSLFWMTKSSAPLPVVGLEELARAPRPVRRWIARAEAQLSRDRP